MSPYDVGYLIGVLLFWGALAAGVFFLIRWIIRKRGANNAD